MIFSFMKSSLFHHKFLGAKRLSYPQMELPDLAKDGSKVCSNLIFFFNLEFECFWWITFFLNFILLKMLILNVTVNTKNCCNSTKLQHIMSLVSRSSVSVGN